MRHETTNVHGQLVMFQCYLRFRARIIHLYKEHFILYHICSNIKVFRHVYMYLGTETGSKYIRTEILESVFALS